MLDDFVLVSALPLLQLTLLDGFPDQWSRATVTGEQIKGNGGLVVSLEVGPIKSDSQRLSLSYYERNPARKKRPHRDTIAELLRSRSTCLMACLGRALGTARP